MEVTKQATTLKQATIGPDAWKEASIRNIRLAQAVVQRSDKFNDLGKQLDPLPSLRDTCVQQSNAHMHGYMRETRTVVIKLKYCLLETDEEIKSLSRAKENLEKILEHIRKDIVLNNSSTFRRKARPVRERQPDGADDLLASEKDHLLKLKRVLEGQLRSVQKQMHVLDNARKRLKAVISERSRVLDLICLSVSSVSPIASHDNVTTLNKKSTETSTNMKTDPLGPCTPEVAESMSLATDAKQRSILLRKGVAEAIEQTMKLQSAAHKSVNDGLTKKISETITMKQHLQVTSGEIRMAKHRGERWHYTTDVARGYTMGPVSSKDLATRERLDRPTVSAYQRHPGTQLPEAQEIIEGNDGLKQSLDAIGRNIALMKLTQDRLKEDVTDKKHGAFVDSSVVRLRRRKYDHRWVISGMKC